MKTLLFTSCLLAFGLIHCNAYRWCANSRIKRSHFNYHLERSSNLKQTPSISLASYHSQHGQLNKDKISFISVNMGRNDTHHFGSVPKFEHELTHTRRNKSRKERSYGHAKKISPTNRLNLSKGEDMKQRRGKRKKIIKLRRLSMMDIEEKTLINYDSVESKHDLMLNDGAISTLFLNDSSNKAGIIVKSFTPPDLHQQPYSKIRIYNLRLVISISDESGCLNCSGNKIIIAKKGVKCAPLLLPVVKSCPNHGVIRSKPLRWSLDGQRRVGRILPEGSHTIILHIKTNSEIRMCSFKYHVKVNRCPFPKPVYNGAADCTQGRAWGSNCLFRCNPGHYMIGNPISACEGNSSGVNWTNEFPVCREINSCLKLEGIKNGILKCDDKISNEFVSSGTICIYTCDFGYDILKKNDSVVSCNEGKWNNSKIPVCEVVQCEKPPDPKNGFLKCSMNNSIIYSGTICQYRCKPGFVIPTSKLNGEFIKCIGSNWNSSNETRVECLEKLAPQPIANTCFDEKITTDELISKSVFLNSAGGEAQVTCSFEGRLEPGVYQNVCEATDLELRTVSTCVYTIEVIDKGCELPKTIPNISINCSKNIEMEYFYPIGTICEYKCEGNYTIPTSQLEISMIKCESNSEWNSSKIPVCKEKIAPQFVAGTCDDINLFVEDFSDFDLKIPKFVTSSGNDVIVRCNVTAILDFGDIVNHCIAWDYELRSNAFCQYQINLRKLECKSLTTPANAKMHCFMSGRKIYRCEVSCKPGTTFLSDDLKKGYVECDVENGKWDFMEKFETESLPDCLGESITSLITDLRFNSSVYDCKNESFISEVQDNIEQGLLSRNRVICDQVDCTDFTYLCDEIRNGVSILETIWNITANFTPANEDDYYYDNENEGPEAEVLLTEIQRETNKIISTDESFHLKLSEVGATVLSDSYKQGIIDLICIKKGFVIDSETFKCLHCPTGTYYSNRKCLPCPLDTYQDETGQMSCKNCPEGAITTQAGSRVKAQCSSLQRNALDDSGSLYDKCDPNPCKNDGACLDVGFDDFICYCAEGFEGSFCEIVTNECPIDFCLNGGSCHFVNGIYTCLCPSETTGLQCEKLIVGAMTVRRVNRNSCKSSPCMKGGICIQDKLSNHYYCHCTKYRTGEHCEHTACPELYGQWFCLNGGQCVILDDTHAMVCLCIDGFIGSRCEYVEDTTDEFSDDDVS